MHHAYVAEEGMATWHQRLGHLNIDMITKLPNYVDGMKITNEIIDKDCIICSETKMTKRPFGTIVRKATRPMQIIHTDVARPMKTASAYEAHVFGINFVDEHSRKVAVYTMKKKSEA